MHLAAACVTYEAPEVFVCKCCGGYRSEDVYSIK